MTSSGKEQIIAFLRVEISKLEAALAAIQQVKTSNACNGCLQFTNGYCQIFKDSVPAEFQLTGCESFEDDIPF